MFDAAGRNLLQRNDLEFTQDLIVCGLCLLLMSGTDFSSVIFKLLFILVLLKLFRLLLLYLDEDRVSVATTVEVRIVSTQREVISRGQPPIDWPQLPVVCVFMLTFGAVLRFSGIRLYAKGSTPGDERTIRPGARLVRPTPMPARSVRAKQI